MPTGPLTADERDLLAVVARSPDEGAWRTHYRLLKLPGHEGGDNSIQRRINGLLKRGDAKAVLDQQRHDLDRNRLDAMKESDGAHWQHAKVRAELEESIYRLAQAAMDHELKKFNSGGKPSTPSSVAKLLETGLKIAGREGGDQDMLPEERLLLAKKVGIVQGEQAVVPALPPGVEEGKA